MIKVEDFVKRFGDILFYLNIGWLESFKILYSIVFRFISGELAEVNVDLENNWLTIKLSILIKNYESRDIFNVDEIVLFYKLFLNKYYN